MVEGRQGACFLLVEAWLVSLRLRAMLDCVQVAARFTEVLVKWPTLERLGCGRLLCTETARGRLARRVRTAKVELPFTIDELCESFVLLGLLVMGRFLCMGL